MTPAAKNLLDLNQKALKPCSLAGPKGDWGNPHYNHPDGHDCGADENAAIHMDDFGGIDYVDCRVCHLLLQVG